MGACLSGGGGSPLIDSPNGGEQDFHNRFVEDRVLGEGEFGVVTLVHDMQQARNSEEAPGLECVYACKTLRKGVVFKDNTLYAPIKSFVLQGEVQMLRTLAGQHYCLEMEAVYETPRVIYMVTEFLSGGEMMEYVSKQEDDLRTDDVSRIAFQMLDAVNHCATHDIIHRDIKPENIMFLHSTPGSDLRLIDFGSGTNRAVEGMHTTFAGSAFYISPEMFQRTYTYKTDVWSVGVTLYVLVAGYPADVLQKAFNMLQQTSRDLRFLPNLPDNMPDSYYDLLDGLLTYKHKKRKSAGEVLDHEFVQFHKEESGLDDILLQAAQAPVDVNGSGSRMARTKSVALRGSVGRHTLFLDYRKYQRSLTTLLATLLDKHDLQLLMILLHEKLNEKTNSDDAENKSSPETKEKGDAMVPAITLPGANRLDVIPISELKTILREQSQDQVLAMAAKLPGSSSYNSFAYEVALLKDFVRDEDRPDGSSQSVRNRRRSRRRGGSSNGSLRNSFRGAGSASVFSKRTKGDPTDDSIHSTGSLRGRNNSVGAGIQRPRYNTSVRGAGDFKDWKSGGMKNPRGKTAKADSEFALKRSISQ